jgi:pyruvate,water dikinase
VQARPETIHSQKNTNKYENYFLLEKGEVIVTGTAVGTKIGQGTANVIQSTQEMDRFKEGQVLVSSMTDPDWEPIMKIAAAIVTNKGGRTCHAAIVSRELGIPCVIGTGNADEIIKNGQEITVSCCEGETGLVYGGLLKYEVETLDLDRIPATRTKIMMNVGMPEKAFSQGLIPNDGVGLAREEFIINAHIGIHPLALLNFDKLKKKAKNDQKIAGVVYRIEELTTVYEDKRQFFIDKLAEGVSRIAAGFYPNDVIVRLSDFKTNEYENLLGGFLYEPKENNPMIGWRGASRYYDEGFMPAFELECLAIRKARSEVGMNNIKVMVPFCRTPEEGKRVIELMKRFGLKQGEEGLEVYVMCEIPSNVICADQFAEIFDGFSIGSNDLTQLTLGLDRDSALVAHIYDERNLAVKRLVSQVIQVAKKKGKKIGICGQAPSDFPDFAEFLVECGIDSISLIPDTVIKTRLLVAKKEKELGISVENN